MGFMISSLIQILSKKQLKAKNFQLPSFKKVGIAYS
jgi:hypothetical protein